MDLKQPWNVSGFISESVYDSDAYAKKSVTLLCSIKMHFIKASKLRDWEKEAESSGLYTSWQ